MPCHLPFTASTHAFMYDVIFSYSRLINYNNTDVSTFKDDHTQSATCLRKSINSAQLCILFREYDYLYGHKELQTLQEPSCKGLVRG